MSFVLAERTLGPVETGEYGDEEMTVTLRLHDLAPESQPPHFSVTTTIYEKRLYGRVDVGGGAAGEEAVRLFPQIEPVVRVHLADPWGVPLHAIENGLWHLGFSRYRGLSPVYDQAAACRHFRCTPEQADAWNAYLKADETEHYSEALRFCLQADGMPGQWEKEANEALSVILDRDAGSAVGYAIASRQARGLPAPHRSF